MTHNSWLAPSCTLAAPKLIQMRQHPHTDTASKMRHHWNDYSYPNQRKHQKLALCKFFFHELSNAGTPCHYSEKTCSRLVLHFQVLEDDDGGDDDDGSGRDCDDDDGDDGPCMMGDDDA